MFRTSIFNGYIRSNTNHSLSLYLRQFSMLLESLAYNAISIKYRTSLLAIDLLCRGGPLQGPGVSNGSCGAVTYNESIAE
jgi:hypothetical protein